MAALASSALSAIAFAAAAAASTAASAALAACIVASAATGATGTGRAGLRSAISAAASSAAAMAAASFSALSSSALACALALALASASLAFAWAASAAAFSVAAAAVFWRFASSAVSLASRASRIIFSTGVSSAGGASLAGASSSCCSSIDWKTSSSCCPAGAAEGDGQQAVERLLDARLGAHLLRAVVLGADALAPCVVDAGAVRDGVAAARRLGGSSPRRQRLRCTGILRAAPSHLHAAHQAALLVELGVEVSVGRSGSLGLSLSLRLRRRHICSRRFVGRRHGRVVFIPGEELLRLMRHLHLPAGRALRRHRVRRRNVDALGGCQAVRVGVRLGWAEEVAARLGAPLAAHALRGERVAHVGVRGVPSLAHHAVAPQQLPLGLGGLGLLGDALPLLAEAEALGELLVGMVSFVVLHVVLHQKGPRAHGAVDDQHALLRVLRVVGLRHAVRLRVGGEAVRRGVGRAQAAVGRDQPLA
eukprot:scaffold43172_cov49-Phaeocystis_antarctica.AAC.3